MVAAEIFPREELRWITSVTCKTWERYGIHALEAVYPVLGPGFTSVQAISQPGKDLVHLTHRCGCGVTVAALFDAVGSFGSVHVYGTMGEASITLRDTYTAFRRQLMAFIEMLRTGNTPFHFGETIELMLILIAGIRSREDGGRVVSMDEMMQESGACESQYGN
jgi:hypothetical protein